MPDPDDMVFNGGQGLKSRCVIEWFGDSCGGGGGRGGYYEKERSAATPRCDVMLNRSVCITPERFPLSEKA